MPRHCAVCQQDFIMEPGFYSGALWTSYPIVVIILTAAWLVFHSLFKLSDLISFFIGSLIVLILQPIIMRVGRAFWINLFVRYAGR
jgi:multisubunit Na+/H+ antiporter MnhE subunit